MRVVVLGTSGSGKTTLASDIAKHHKIKHIELDVLYWNPGWQPTPMPVFLEKIQQQLNENSNWVVCGNYNQAKQITLPQATHIIWLDYALHLNLWRVFIRSLQRILGGGEPFKGCPETFRQTFFSRQSLLLWVLNTHKRRRTEFTELLTQSNFPNAKIYRVQSNRELDLLKTELL